MDAWMLAAYIERFGAPRNVVLLRSAPSGYARGHTVEFMAGVPYEWGYWDRFGVAPEWKEGEQLELFLTKYGVLYSNSDILRDRMLKPWDAFTHGKVRVSPYNGYSMGSKLGKDTMNIQRRTPDHYFGPFKPSNDATNALSFMSNLARSKKFQLYILFQPEWDEAVLAGLRNDMINAQLEYLSQFADPTYVHVVRDSSLTFQTDQMQNTQHLYPGAERIYSEVYISAIAAAQNRLAVEEARPLKLDSTVLDKARYASGDQPVLRVKIAAQESGRRTTVTGSVFCLVKPTGSSDQHWVMRAPAVAMRLGNSGTQELKLDLNIGLLDKVGIYDLVVFVRQDVGSLSNETRFELPGKIMAQ